MHRNSTNHDHPLPEFAFRNVRIAFCSLFAICVFLFGCGPKDDQSRLQPVTIVVSGDTGGWISPCGCASNQSGGLLRRGTYLKQLRKQGPVVYLDAGGAGLGAGKYDRLKFEAILRGEKEMGVAAHNLGQNELWMGPQFLSNMKEATGIPFVSTNVRTAFGETIGQPIIRVETEGGSALLVMGVISPSVTPNGYRIDPPRKSILDALKQREANDFVVVLAYMPADELRQLAEELPEVDAVIGGPTGQAIAPNSVGPVTLASATNQGKFLVQLTVPSPGEQVTGEVVEMRDEWKDDPDQVENLARFRGVVAAESFGKDDLVFPRVAADLALLRENDWLARRDLRVAGTSQCRQCHVDDCKSWSRSAHAHAFASLENTGAHVDPYCQQCHTTGFGLPEGFVSFKDSSKDLQNVGCESCHGPSLGHALDPQNVSPSVFREQAAMHCISCHDHENSPHFNYETYWPKIAHGAKAKQP
jgi:hypothetical protein